MLQLMVTGMTSFDWSGVLQYLISFTQTFGMRKRSVHKLKTTFHLTAPNLLKCISLKRTGHGELYVSKRADFHAAATRDAVTFR